MKEGYGTYNWNDGTYYKGNFKDNNFHGKGVYEYKPGCWYEGDYVNGDIQGQGVFRWDTGALYIGGFKSDKKEGRGMFRKADGCVLVGDWTADKKNGVFWIFEPESKVKQRVKYLDNKIVEEDDELVKLGQADFDKIAKFDPYIKL